MCSAKVKYAETVEHVDVLPIYWSPKSLGDSAASWWQPQSICGHFSDGNQGHSTHEDSSSTQQRDIQEIIPTLWSKELESDARCYQDHPTLPTFTNLVRCLVAIAIIIFFWYTQSVFFYAFVWCLFFLAVYVLYISCSLFFFSVAIYLRALFLFLYCVYIVYISCESRASWNSKISSHMRAEGASLPK